MYKPPGRFERAIDKVMVYVVAPYLLTLAVLSAAVWIAH